MVFTGAGTKRMEEGRMKVTSVAPEPPDQPSASDQDHYFRNTEAIYLLKPLYCVSFESSLYPANADLNPRFLDPRLQAWEHHPVIFAHNIHRFSIYPLHRVSQIM